MSKPARAILIGLASLGASAPLVLATGMSLPSVRMGVGTVRLSPEAPTAPMHRVRVTVAVRPHCEARHRRPIGPWVGNWYAQRIDQRDVDERAWARDLTDLAREHDPQLLGEETEVRAAASPGPLATAREAIARGDAQSAHDALAQVLAQTNDAQQPEALLLAGFAHALAGDFEQAGAQFAAAYAIDSSLQCKPLDGVSVCGSANRLRTLAQRASRNAHKTPSRDAWFAVAVFVHAQGKDARANELMLRAMAHPESDV
ncbi:MAG: hypothetical protein KDA20_03940 [Phycisphaerales bacterium]|nr:hypothetical protein [Phycisphaerales bacterium]